MAEIDEELLTVKKYVFKKLISCLDKTLNESSRNSHCTSVLHESLENNIEVVVDWLLDLDVNLNKDGSYALYHAVKSNNVLLVQKIICKDSYVNGKQKPSDRTALHLAVMLGNDDIVRLLLERGANVNLTDIRGKTPLHYSMEYDDKHNSKENIALLLLRYGANVNLQDYEWQTPLHICLKQPSTVYSIELLKSLLLHNADVNKCNFLCCPPLMLASKMGCAVSVRLLIEHGAKINNELHFCSSKEVVDVLVENGADINFYNKYQDTPLMCALMSGHSSTAYQLLEHGADVMHKNVEGRTALHLCKDEHIVKVLVERGADVNAEDNDGNTPLITAINECYANSGTPALLKILIDLGSDVNHKNNEGETALHLGLYSDEIIKILVENGADVNIEDNKANTPLLSGGNYCTISTIKLLLKLGANVNHRNVEGWTALHYYRSEELVRVLVEGGADVNAEDNAGNTPIFMSATYTYQDIDTAVLLNKLLIKLGADVNHKNKEGKTALHFSLYNDNIIEILVDNGANVNEEDNEGNTPLLLVCKFNCSVSTVKLLLELGADVNHQNMEGETALHFCKSGEILDMLLEWDACVNVQDNKGITPLHRALIEVPLADNIFLFRFPK